MLANQAFRAGASAALPDCRAYEMVSPVDKEGGDIVGAGGLDPTARGGAEPGGGRRTSSPTAPTGPSATPNCPLDLQLHRRRAGARAGEPCDRPAGRAADRATKSLGPNTVGSQRTSARGGCGSTDPPLAEGAIAGYWNIYRRAERSAGPRLRSGDYGETGDGGTGQLPGRTAGAAQDGSMTVFAANAQLAGSGAPANCAPAALQLYAKGSGSGPGGSSASCRAARRAKSRARRGPTRGRSPRSGSGATRACRMRSRRTAAASTGPTRSATGGSSCVRTPWRWGPNARGRARAARWTSPKTEKKSRGRANRTSGRPPKTEPEPSTPPATRAKTTPTSTNSTSQRGEQRSWRAGWRGWWGRARTRGAPTWSPAKCSTAKQTARGRRRAKASRTSTSTKPARGPGRSGSWAPSAPKTATAYTSRRAAARRWRRTRSSTTGG